MSESHIDVDSARLLWFFASNPGMSAKEYQAELFRKAARQVVRATSMPRSPKPPKGGKKAKPAFVPKKKPSSTSMFREPGDSGYYVRKRLVKSTNPQIMAAIRHCLRNGESSFAVLHEGVKKHLNEPAMTASLLKRMLVALGPEIQYNKDVHPMRIALPQALRAANQ